MASNFGAGRDVNSQLRPFVYYVTNHDWFGYQHFYQGLAQALSVTRPVLYVGPPSRWPRGPREAKPGLTKLADNIWVLRTAIPRGTSRASMAWLRDRLIARDVRRALRRIGISEADVLIWTYTADAVELIRRVRSPSVYWTGDEVVDAKESTLLALVDRVLAVSPLAFAEKRALVGDRVALAPMAIAPEPFERAARQRLVPEDLANLPGPIFGYGGAVNARIDWPLLHKLARDGGGSVVVVGPATDDVGRKQARSAQSGIHFLGHRDEATAPHYVAAFDVGLIPYLETKFNIGSNPVKTYQYLAAGVPVVATRLPAIEPLRAVVEIVDSHEGFIAAARRLAAEPRGGERAEARRAEASKYSYDSLVCCLERLLGDDLLRRG